MRSKILSIGVLCLMIGLAGRTAAGQSIYRKINDSTLLSSGGFEIDANGNVSMVPADLQVCSSLVDPSCLATLDVSVQTSVNVSLEVKAGFSGSFQKEWPGSLTPLPPFTAGGYTVTPYLYVSVGVIGTIDANVVASVVEQWGIEAAFSMGGGAGFTGSTQPLDKVLQVEGPVLTAGSQAALEVYVNAALYFDIWTAGGFPIGGPILAVRPSATLTAQPALDPWWTLEGSHYTGVGWFFWGLGVPFPTTLTDTTFPIADAGAPLGNLATLAESRWARTYEIQGTTVEGSAIAVTSGGSLLVAGNGDGLGNRQLLLELDGAGTVTHEERSDLGQGGRPRAIIETADGGLLVAGSTSTTSIAYLARYDSAGTFLWKKELSGSSTAINDVTETANGDLLCTGVAGAALNPWVVRLDGSGAVLWSQEFIPTVLLGGPVGVGYEIIEMTNGNIAMVGNVAYSDDPNSAITQTIASQNAFVLMMDASGAQLWAKVYGNTGFAGAKAACEATNGDLIIAGDSSSEDQSAWVARVAPDGTMVWSKSFAGEASGTSLTDPGNTPYDVITDIEPTEGGFIATGTTSLVPFQDAWLLKLDNEGRMVWFKSFRGGDLDQLHDVEVIDDRQIVAVGTTRTFSGGTSQLMVVRTSVDGMLHFEETGGVQLMDVHNDGIARSDTSSTNAHDVPGALIATAPIEATNTMTSTTAGVANVLRTQ